MARRRISYKKKSVFHGNQFTKTKVGKRPSPSSLDPSPFQSPTQLISSSSNKLSLNLMMSLKINVVAAVYVMWIY